MISLFNINHYTLDTSTFDNVINGSVVKKFEREFAEYVGAKYACGVNSATNAIFLSLLDKHTTVKIPSVIPPVVLNAITLSGNKILFEDNTDWVGDSYVLHKFKEYKIIDSAQKVERDQFKIEANPEDLMIFSFYPTKPVGSIDGGIIVSNDKDKIEWFKKAVLNGTSKSPDSWERMIHFPGWKSYLSSCQAKIASENLKKLDSKNLRLSEIRDYYNSALGFSNTSSHLYRISSTDRDLFIKEMKSRGIVCGIHYNAMHLNKVYCNTNIILPKSERVSLETVSIPFHEMLTDSQVEYIIECCRELG
tara:strand:+ start:24809 stop:25726 length:918 start_codon:yes stop_codon:yes gene_type:complete